MVIVVEFRGVNSFDGACSCRPKMSCGVESCLSSLKADIRRKKMDLASVPLDDVNYVTNSQHSTLVLRFSL